MRISASKAAVGAASCQRESGWPSHASRRTLVRKALRPTANGTSRAVISSTASFRAVAGIRSRPQAVLIARSSSGTLMNCRAARARTCARRASPLSLASSGASDREHPAAHEALDRGLAGRRLPERRQDLRDVPEEQRVRTHDQHALLVELLAVLEQEERCSVEPHRGLARAGTALHHEAGVDGGPDHHVLLGGDRGHDVAHLAGAGALELGEERIRDPPVVGRVDAVRIVEHLIEQVVDLSSGHQEPAPPAQLHRVGRGRSVEGRGHGRSPIDHDRIAALVLHMPAPDVPGVAVLGVEAAEGEAVDVRCRACGAGRAGGPVRWTSRRPAPLTP